MNKTLKRLTKEADLQSWLCKGKKRTGCGGGAFVSEGTRKKPKARKKPAKKATEARPDFRKAVRAAKKKVAKPKAKRTSGRKVYNTPTARAARRSKGRKPGNPDTRKADGRARKVYLKGAKRAKVRKTRAKSRGKK